MWCAAAVSFWCQLRLGEILDNSCTYFDTNYNPTRSDYTAGCLLTSSHNLRLPWTKTSKNVPVDITITHQHAQCTLCLTAAMQNHLDVNKSIPENLSLFSFSLKGYLYALSKSTMIRRCNTVFSKFDVPMISGHTIMIGVTTNYLLSGVDSPMVQKSGHWSSNSFLLYWRSLPEIVNLHLSNR